MTTVETATDTGDEVGPRLRRLRVGRRLTLKAVAVAAGVTEGYLSQIETGRTAPSLKTFRRIASALGMDPADVLDSGDAPLPRLVPRHGGRALSIGTVSKYRVTPSSLSSMEVLRGELAVGGSTGEGYTHGDSEEVLIVVSGDVEATIAQQAFAMTAGDSLCYRSSMGHSIRNAGESPALVMWVTSPPAHAAYGHLDPV